MPSVLVLLIVLATIPLLMSQNYPDAAELRRMMARFAPAELRVDSSKLPEGDRKALAKLIEAARAIDELFLVQFWNGNPQLRQKLRKDTSELGRLRYEYFWLNKGPWSALDHHKAFLPGVPAKKPAGSNFYPEDMTKEEFEAWEKTLSADERKLATGFFSVIRRERGKLKAIPYNVEYRKHLTSLSQMLRDAALLTTNPSLKRFLDLRADAFLSNDYYASDVAWMDLDAPIDVTIGPYETYNDEIFGYKAAFEAYITLRDDAETKKVESFSSLLQEIEDNLPIDPKYRNPRIGASAPIRVVNEVYSAGDAAHGVRTAAFNLPNDEKVIVEKGSKRVMLKNVQEAKFRHILIPIARSVLAPSDQDKLSFEQFFTHILAHELTHGIGPHNITINGKASTPRRELKELYSSIEEAKADVTGLFMLQYMFDRKLLPAAEAKLYTSFLASTFRTLRFGLNEAHAKGMAIQTRFFLDKGAFTVRPDGTFTVDLVKMKSSVRDLTSLLLTIEATGDYAGARRLLDNSLTLAPAITAAIGRLKQVPTDINPSANIASATGEMPF